MVFNSGKNPSQTLQLITRGQNDESCLLFSDSSLSCRMQFKLTSLLLQFSLVKSEPSFTLAMLPGLQVPAAQSMTNEWTFLKLPENLLKPQNLGSYPTPMNHPETCALEGAPKDNMLTKTWETAQKKNSALYVFIPVLSKTPLLCLKFCSTKSLPLWSETCRFSSAHLELGIFHYTLVSYFHDRGSLRGLKACF